MASHCPQGRRLRPSYPQPGGRTGTGEGVSATVEGTRWHGATGNPRRIVMSQGGYVTLVGFVAQDPSQRETSEGRVTHLRVGATFRVQDRVTREWRDADTSYFTVSCWRRLGDHVRASCRKGDPVVVKGRFRTRSWEDKAGQIRTVVDISADTVGHDLNRGVANYVRQRPQPARTEGHRV